LGEIVVPARRVPQQLTRGVADALAVEPRPGFRALPVHVEVADQGREEGRHRPPTGDLLAQARHLRSGASQNLLQLQRGERRVVYEQPRARLGHRGQHLGAKKLNPRWSGSL